MIPYVITSVRAWQLSRPCIRLFNISLRRRIHYRIKACNLALCFLGFSIHKGTDYFKRCAELGILASVYDLVSDEFRFDPTEMSKFRGLLERLLDSAAFQISWQLMEDKKSGLIRFDGLARGVAALKVIINHLGMDSLWPNEEIVRAGILCQVVDDILDYPQDVAKGNLNFLKSPAPEKYIQALLDWDYRQQFRQSEYPFVLFRVIDIAQKKAVKLVNAGSINLKSAVACE